MEEEDGSIKEERIQDTPIYRYYAGDRKALKEYDIKREIWQTKEELLEEVNHL